MNQTALIFSYRIFITVADNREMLPNRCHSATANGKTHVFTPSPKGRLLFPLHKSPSGLNNFV